FSPSHCTTFWLFIFCFFLSILILHSFTNTHFCTARSFIVFYFFFTWHQRLFCQHLERPFNLSIKSFFHLTIHIPMPEIILHPTLLQRMKGYDSHSSTRFYKFRQAFQKPRQLSDFIVHFHPTRLKHLRQIPHFIPHRSL